MDRGLIVIDNAGIVTEKEINDNKHHVDLLKEYLEEKDLIYPQYEESTGYEISIYLASLMHVSVHVENNKHVYFIGEFITDKQYEYFKKNKRSLRRHQTIFCNIENGQLVFYDEYSHTDCNIFNMLMEKVEEKSVISSTDVKKERK